MLRSFHKVIAAVAIGISIVAGFGTVTANAFGLVGGKPLIFEEIKGVGILYLLIPFLLFGIAAIFIPKIIAIIRGIGLIVGMDNETLDKIVETVGYKYDPIQDIFYSNLDAWQRKFGYCRLYDEASAPFGMIIDCEPVYFEYGGKEWMIEFWKGQYDLTTGCEIGVYTKGLDLSIPGLFNGAFYNSVSDTEMLHMSCSLRKNGKRLFFRKDRHWWLTGFKLGEFSEPWDLTMFIKITFITQEMRDAFVEALINAGYSRGRILTYGKTVRFIFQKPVTKQPFTRNPETDSIIQKKNKLMCDTYQQITGVYNNIADKLKAVKEQAPDLYKHILNMGKGKQIFENYGTIKKMFDMKDDKEEE